MRTLVFLILLSGLATLGCNGGRASASGTVSADGTPLETGMVTFHPSDGGPTAYGQVNGGKFTLYTGQEAGLEPGSYKVTVASHAEVPVGSYEKPALLTPEKYTTPQTTDLTADVKPGRNRFEFDLKGQ